GRIYQKRLQPTDGALGAEGWVWSNRLGALPIFADEEPEADERGWALFAAAGWFIADATPIRGATKVAPGSAIVVRAGAGGAGAHLDRHQTGGAGELVGPQEIRRPMPLPLPVEPTRPTISGHGGEIAHGFYYPSQKKLSEVREGGEAGLVDRLEEAARQEHAAAHRDAYRAYREEAERALDD